MTTAPLPGIEIWRGGVNSWECDEMGHMNVRFYVARAMEGLVGLAAELGLPHAFTPYANASLIVREHHIRFLREAQAGAPMHMLGGVIDIGDGEARLLQLLVHSGSGELAASFQTTVAHVTPREGEPFAWPRVTVERAKILRVDVPERARARGVSQGPFTATAALDRAERLGLAGIGLGALEPADCDVFGRMRAEQFIGRVSDGIGAFMGPFRDMVGAGDLSGPRPGAAVLEYRIAYLAWPRAGDRVALRSGLVNADARTLKIVHWMLDPATGRPWITSECIAVTFDLTTRKAMAIPEAAQAPIAAFVVAGLGL